MIKTILTPEKRKQYIQEQLLMDGLFGLVEEDPQAAYCALPLTNTPDAAKPFVKERQALLKTILQEANISSYDPGTAPFSPDINLTATPEEIYRTDLGRVAGARFFTAFDTFPSTGLGVELEAARRYNRIPVIFHDRAIRTSRMQPNCAIHIETDSLEKDAKQITKIFHLLKTYTPGRGIKEGQPMLLGFKDGKGVDLVELIAEKFPELRYVYDGTKPPVKFIVANLEDHKIF